MNTFGEMLMELDLSQTFEAKGEKVHPHRTRLQQCQNRSTHLSRSSSGIELASPFLKGFQRGDLPVVMVENTQLQEQMSDNYV